MKNYFCIILIILTSFLFSQDCESAQPSTGTGSVTYPSAGTVLEQGASLDITWNYSGPGQCHLFLYNNNDFILEIYDWAINDGEYTWSIPQNLDNSACYQIVIGYHWTGDSPGDLPNNDYDYIVSDYFSIHNGEYEFSSTEATFSGNDLTFIELDITDAGTITDLNIMLNLDHEAQNGLYYLTIQLLSPYGNSVELGHGADNGSSPYWTSDDGGNLYNTVFDDESSTLIYDGTAPFAGPYQPDASLSDFDGQSITGTWQLLVTNSSGNSGTVEFTIMVETDSSTPDSYPDYGTGYSSTEATFSGNDLTFIELDITDAGTTTRIFLLRSIKITDIIYTSKHI